MKKKTTTKLVATVKQLIRKNSCSLFEKSGNFFFSQSERTDRLDLSPPPPPPPPCPCSFSFALYGPPSSTTNILFECPLLVQNVTTGKPNVSARYNQKIPEIFSHTIYLLDVIYSYFFNRYNRVSNKKENTSTSCPIVYYRVLLHLIKELIY